MGCGVKPELLPFKKYPSVEKVLFLKKIIVHGESVEKIFFKDKIIPPFFIYLELKDVEGEGFIILKLYNNKQEIYHKKFSFGKKGKLYDSIIIWDRIEIKKYRKLKYAIFYKKNLIYRGDLDIKTGKNKIIEK